MRGRAFSVVALPMAFQTASPGWPLRLPCPVVFSWIVLLPACWFPASLLLLPLYDPVVFILSLLIAPLLPRMQAASILLGYQGATAPFDAQLSVTTNCGGVNAILRVHKYAGEMSWEPPWSHSGVLSKLFFSLPLTFV